MFKKIVGLLGGICVLFYSYHCHSHPNANINLSEQFEGIKYTANRITNICSFEDCVVVGLGRSPTPFTAYLRLITPENENYIVNIPVSSFRYGTKSIIDLGDWFGPVQRDLTPQEEIKLWAHFDRFFPTDEELTGVKTLLLVDVGIRGLSLLAANIYISKYFKEVRKIPIEIRTQVITDKCDEGKRKLFDHCISLRYLFVRRDSKKSLKKSLHGQRYDPYSEFFKFKIEKHPLDKAFFNLRHMFFNLQMIRLIREETLRNRKLEVGDYLGK